MDQPVYHFGTFDLSPEERLLRNSGKLVQLPPKTMDALVYLVLQAGRLIKKKELISYLWPETFVGDTNLTNIVVVLRKTIGQDAIQTVAKHGYRFTLKVHGGQAAQPASLQERFARAKELAYRSRESIEEARNLLLLCIAQDPGFAPAWAWLGRCSALVVKICGTSQSASELASAAFDRAFTLDPHLAVAHQFYTSFQIDRGFARSAMTRLLQRLGHRPDETETLSGLVQVLRCCGLLEESLAVSQRAYQIDPAVLTSAPHTYFLKCDYGAAIDSYGGRSGYYMDAAAWAALGATTRAQKLLTERLAKLAPSGLMTTLMTSLKLILEGRNTEAADMMRDHSEITDPEYLVYLARHFCLIDMPDQARKCIERAAANGFIMAPETLKEDPALTSLRNYSQFPGMLRFSERQVRAARTEWKSSASAVHLFRETETEKDSKAPRGNTRSAQLLDL